MTPTSFHFTAPRRPWRRSPMGLAVLLMATAATAFAQVPPTAPAAPAAPAPPPVSAGPARDAALPPPAGPRPAPRAKRDERPAPDAGVVSTVTGRVARWLPNPNGDIDGLLLDNGTQVALRPMESARLMQSVKLGDTVQVTGTRGGGKGPRPADGGPEAAPGGPDAEAARLASRPTTGGALRAMEVRNAAGTTLALTEGEPGTAPRPPTAPRRDLAALTPMTASGRITTVLVTGRGDVNGAVMYNGTVVRFPPHVGSAMAQDLKAGGTLYARGYGTSNAAGSAFEATRLGATEGVARDVFAPPTPPAPPAPTPPPTTPR